MNLKIKNDISFAGVALAFIVLGAVIFTIGLVSWFLLFSNSSVISWPGSKVISGTIIMALGYIILELEILRRK